jgi:hypothetical protein
MSKNKIISQEFDGVVVSFNKEGWISATVIAEKYGKKPIEWLRLPETKKYLTALAEKYKVEPSHFVKTTRGGSLITRGTWLHPKLGVRFAQWLDVNFAIWCDEQVSHIIHGNPEETNWKLLRHEAAVSYKVMSSTLLSARQVQGKDTEHYHYANEAKLISYAFSGEFKEVDRQKLTTQELDILAKLEVQNSVLLGLNVSYGARKDALAALARAMLEPLTLPPAKD